MTHDRGSRGIIRREVESAIQTYLISGDADARASGSEREGVSPTEFLSTEGGTLAIGGRCFLIRPARQQPNKDGGLDPPAIVGDDDRRNAASSTSKSGMAPEKEVRGSIADLALSTTDVADDKIGQLQRQRSQSISLERDEALGSNVFPNRRGSETSSIPVEHIEKAGVTIDNALPHYDGPGSLSMADNNDTTSNASDQAPQKATDEERRREIHGPISTAEAGSIPGASPGVAEESVDGSMKPPSNDGVSEYELEEEGEVTTVANAGKAGSPAAKTGDEEDCGMDGVGADGVARRDLPPQESGKVPGTPTCDATLKALLRDMSRAAEALPPALSKALSGSAEEGRETSGETTGCTVVVFLDAPLITPGLCRRQTLLLNERTQPSVPRRRPTLATEESADQDVGDVRDAADLQDVAAASDADTSAPTRGSDVSDIGLIDKGGEQNSGDDRGDDGSDNDNLNPHEQHPAGLGDPNEALDALLLWAEEGESSGLGRREVLLVCCSEPLSRFDAEEGRNDALRGIDIRSAGQSDDSTEAFGAPSEIEDGHGKDGPDSREGSFADEGVEQVLQKLSLGGPRQSIDGDNPASGDGTGELGVKEGDVILGRKGSVTGGEFRDGQPSMEDLAFCFAGKPKRDRRPGMIQQMILGEVNPFSPTPQQTGEESSVHETPEGSTNMQDMIRTGDEAKKRRVSSAAERAKSHTTAGRTPSPPVLSSAFTKPSATPVRLHPTEVLLQTRPVASTAEGVSRLAIFLPPPSPGKESTELSSPREPKTSSLELNPKTNHASRHDLTLQESIRVLVGPVVGHVGPTSAVVLVEMAAVNPAAAAAAAAIRVVGNAVRREGFTGVSAAADAVGVRLTDTLTGQRREMTGGEWAGGQSGSGPQVFTFRGLSPGRRYALKLLGVRRRDQVRSSASSLSSSSEH